MIGVRAKSQHTFYPIIFVLDNTFTYWIKEKWAHAVRMFSGPGCVEAKAEKKNMMLMLPRCYYTHHYFAEFMQT